MYFYDLPEKGGEKGGFGGENKAGFFLYVSFLSFSPSLLRFRNFQKQLIIRQTRS